VRKGRSKQGIVHLALDVKTWLQRPPSVEAARPGTCPCCRAASRPVGGRLGLWGHGLRERQLCGPGTPTAAAQVVVVLARRYLCCACGTVVLVVPAEVAPRRHYSRCAIGLAMALFGIARQSAAEVRRRVSPFGVVGTTAASGWATLRRWVAAVRRGGLLSRVRAVPAAWTARQAAERIASSLAAQAPPSCSALALEAQAFVGARAMA
jgi:hypothetical protein